MTPAVTLITDTRVLSIPIKECGERLVDLRALDGPAFDNRKRDAAELWLHAREGVARRLLLAQAVCPPLLRLLIVEAFRPVEVQERYFEAYSARLRGEHPDWTARAIREFASRHVAPPDIDPPHSTGGAVDVTLVDDTGNELDLGTPVNASPEDSDDACYTGASGLGEAAAANRSQLVHVMTSAGFVNYGTEWWHWSYGDRYWAHVTGAPDALYGSTAPTDADELSG
jgi:D-alanyl-D-alanine dipeptidase